MNKAREVLAIRHGNPSDVYDNKHDALAIAHAVAKGNGYCFAVEGRFGWHASVRKPSIRAGKVIECRDGREFLA